MQDQDNEYPRRSRPSRGENARRRDEDELEDEALEPERPRRRAPAAFYEDEEAPPPPLPANGIVYTLLVGVAGGIIAFGVNVAITFINSPLFQKQIQEGKNLSYNTALAVLGVSCLNFVVTLVIYAIIGFVIGKVAVQRRLAFWAGAIAGAIVYGASFLTAYIPGYPSTQASAGNPVPTPSVSGTMTAIGISVVFFLITALIGALLSLFGAWLATRRHPYYYR